MKLKISDQAVFWTGIAITTAGLLFAEWWATRTCCGNVPFAARASCCAAGQDCSKAEFCPAVGE